ncbi:hypothetical protein AB0950_38045 [Streptomyces sp. NPDC007189]|uniref:hypothetical protein n=1 Tax=Streptomyces sp. NPDC007189 TaxID=3154315 RepID=UPI00345629B9
MTNAVKYAPGPLLLELEVSDGAVEISVWDTDPALPAACRADPGGSDGTGWAAQLP